MIINDANMAVNPLEMVARTRNSPFPFLLNVAMGPLLWGAAVSRAARFGQTFSFAPADQIG
jgi:hypothetical protein